MNKAQRIGCLLAMLAMLTGWLGAQPATAQNDNAGDAGQTTTTQQAESTQQPEQSADAVKLDSPQAAMQAYLSAMDEVRRDIADGQDWARVKATMDTSQIQDSELPVAAAQLLEVLDKLGTVDVSQLPDAARVQAANTARYVYFPYG